MTQLTLGETTFTLSPTIGTCIRLQKKGIDLLGIGGESELQKLVANPIDFLSALEVLISKEADGDEQYSMPELASFMCDGVWPATRKAVLESFQTFFRDNGYKQLEAALRAYEGAATEVTDAVTESLRSGNLKQAIETAVGEAIEDLTDVGGEDENEPNQPS